MKIKKVALVGKHSKKIEQTVKDFGFKLVRKDPDAVICYGGDGTLLYGEHKFPGVPKASIKNSKICNMCEPGSTICRVLRGLANDRYKIKEWPKIEGQIAGKKSSYTIGLNEVQIHNIMPSALRFDVYVDGKLVEKNVIGDGLVVATPFGSTAYFHSVARKKFRKGFAVGYNNTTRKIAPLMLKDNQKVRVKINRGPGFITSDNTCVKHKIKDGDTVIVKISKQKAKIISLK